MRLLLITLCLTLALSGCSRFFYDLGEPLGDARDQAKGLENLAQALYALGPPMRIATMSDGYVLAWEYWQIGERSLGVSLGAVGAEAMSIDWGRAQLSGEFLLLHFDEQHRLLDYAFSRWDESAGGGAALQPSFAGIDVVDVSDLRRPMSQHRWGASSLRSLPFPLNNASGPDSGLSTLEQRGTPKGAGQRTLEWDE